MSARREGFTITEVLVSVVLLGIVLTTLGGLTYASAQRALVATTSSQRQAYSLETVNRLVALPYASLTGVTGCDVVGGVRNRFQRCVNVVSTGNRRTVTVMTTPIDRPVGATTFSFVRSAIAPPNPLCSGC